jgi:hypothetical protein
MLCLNCARRIVSPTRVSKYGGLTGYLKFRGTFTDTVKLSFARMDGIIGDNLPMDAYKLQKWWENVPTNIHSKAWLDAGWEAQEVNLKEGYVVFKKVKNVQVQAFRRKTHRNQIKKPFTPVHVRVPKPRLPSKTRVSKLYARVKNLERQRISLPAYHGSFRPRPMHEKKLFRPNEKPRRS